MKRRNRNSNISEHQGNPPKQHYDHCCQFRLNMIKPVQMQFLIPHTPPRDACKPHHEDNKQYSGKDSQDCYASSIRSIFFIHKIIGMEIILDWVSSVYSNCINKILSFHRILDHIPPLRRIGVLKIRFKVRQLGSYNRIFPHSANLLKVFFHLGVVLILLAVGKYLPCILIHIHVSQICIAFLIGFIQIFIGCHIAEYRIYSLIQHFKGFIQPSIPLWIIIYEIYDALLADWRISFLHPVSIITPAVYKFNLSFCVLQALKLLSLIFPFIAASIMQFIQNFFPGHPFNFIADNESQLSAVYQFPKFAVIVIMIRIIRPLADNDIIIGRHLLGGKCYHAIVLIADLSFVIQFLSPAV